MRVWVTVKGFYQQAHAKPGTPEAALCRPRRRTRHWVGVPLLLVLDALARRHAGIVVVLDGAHLGDEVGGRHDFVGRPPARHHQLDVLRRGALRRFEVTPLERLAAQAV